MGDPVPANYWTLSDYTAALNCKNLDPEQPNLSWCPKNCGQCYRLCSTGGTINGPPTSPGICRVFKISNRCGDGYPNEPNWCNQKLTYDECKNSPQQCSQN